MLRAVIVIVFLCVLSGDASAFTGKGNALAFEAERAIFGNDIDCGNVLSGSDSIAFNQGCLVESACVEAENGHPKRLPFLRRLVYRPLGPHLDFLVTRKKYDLSPSSAVTCIHPNEVVEGFAGGAVRLRTNQEMKVLSGGFTDVAANHLNWKLSPSLFGDNNISGEFDRDRNPRPFAFLGNAVSIEHSASGDTGVLDGLESGVQGSFHEPNAHAGKDDTYNGHPAHYRRPEAHGSLGIQIILSALCFAGGFVSLFYAYNLPPPIRGKTGAAYAIAGVLAIVVGGLNGLLLILYL